MKNISHRSLVIRFDEHLTDFYTGDLCGETLYRILEDLTLVKKFDSLRGALFSIARLADWCCVRIGMDCLSYWTAIYIHARRKRETDVETLILLFRSCIESIYRALKVNFIHSISKRRLHPCVLAVSAPSPICCPRMFLRQPFY